ncbi:hypothetical protein PC120_g6582 [Phytophthora cactorum]|nr:hypothetical protein PC120_g6582 [Phytophthora cactorum]
MKSEYGAKKKLEDELVATREEYEQLVQDLTTKAESARKHECVQFNLKFDKDDKRIEALKAEVAALRSTQEQQQQERERMQTQEQQLQVQTLELQALTEHSQSLEQQNAALVNKLHLQLETAMQAGLEIEQRAEALEQQLGALHAYLEEQQQEQQKEQLNYQQQEQEKH